MGRLGPRPARRSPRRPPQRQQDPRILPQGAPRPHARRPPRAPPLAEAVAQRADARLRHDSRRSLRASNANWEVFQAQTTTTDATATTLQSVTVPTDSALLLVAKIVGRRTGGSAGANGDSAVYIRTARFKNVGGTVTMHNLQTDYTSEELLQIAWNGTLDVSGTSARIRVTGAANNNITWTVTYEVITLS